MFSHLKKQRNIISNEINLTVLPKHFIEIVYIMLNSGFNA